MAFFIAPRLSIISPTPHLTVPGRGGRSGPLGRGAAKDTLTDGQQAARERQTEGHGGACGALRRRNQVHNLIFVTA